MSNLTIISNLTFKFRNVISIGGGFTMSKNNNKNDNPISEQIHM